MCLVVAMSLRKQQTCFLRRWIGMWADFCRETLRVLLDSTELVMKGWWWDDWWNCNSPHPDLRLLVVYYHSAHLLLYCCCRVILPLRLEPVRQKPPGLVPTKGAKKHFCFLLLDCEDAVELFELSFLYNDTKYSLSPSASYNLEISCCFRRKVCDRTYLLINSWIKNGCWQYCGWLGKKVISHRVASDTETHASMDYELFIIGMCCLPSPLQTIHRASEQISAVGSCAVDAGWTTLSDVIPYMKVLGLDTSLW